MPKNTLINAVFVIIVSTIPTFAQETLPALTGKAPQTHAEMWDGFDPLAEPLDVEVLHEWEEDDVVLKVLRYRAGVFKGKKAMIAAVYGYPKNGKNLPGLVNIHGGGQYADYKAPLTNAKRGYATITIAWAGRISAPRYSVSPPIVKLYWDQKKDDPQFKITTDWGALDGYHAPSKFGKQAFAVFPKPAEWTLDAKDSPRNNSWFLCALAARRGLTFLQKQPQVDPDRLGVYGHSMGGKLTVMTAGSDKRVKAAAPSCGGISDRYNEREIFRNTVGDAPSLQNISCPTIFLSPSNDFHGHINDLVSATNDIKADWRVTCSPHLNHRDGPEFEVATQLWFDQHLKGTFRWPKTPSTKVNLKSDDGIPNITVTPDSSRKVLGVEVYYTQQGHLGGDRNLRVNRMNRFWHSAKATNESGNWSAKLPVFSSQKPLWVYANVMYKLDKPIRGAGYYFGIYETDRFNVSSLIDLVSAKQLQTAGVKPTLKQTPIIESFEDQWQMEWFTHNRKDWSIRTHKVYDAQYAAPIKATIRFEAKSENGNRMVIGIDDFATEFDLKGESKWQSFEFDPSDFKNAKKEPLQNWGGIKELRFVPMENLVLRKGTEQTIRKVGEPWKGSPPEFRDLRWVEKK